MLEDFEALFSDARVYYHAELAFQKTRAAFLADSLKRTIIFATAGAFFGMLATIGLAVGLIIALTPIVGAWVATALVVSLILILGGWCLWKATASWRTMMHAIRDDDHKEANHHG
ncbi:hypothetical protein GRI62_06595 [Erythrobacter arachoides]|uniref:Phage holin family protein n=1 Tax=Aurantiacibacter arachoides TaxID=1850444 RepID=A0A844ZZE9_9SPHN|nr:hypothetical protein [Aurantiacibacter arachoides]MXO93275.1 hypothetical protein [Aurantiacibacter arachoides]